MLLSRIESLCHNPNLPPSAPPFQGVTTSKWASKLYTGGAGFESLVRLFSVVSFSPSRYRWYTIYNRATSASSHTFPIHYSLNILVFDAIHSVPDTFVNPLKPNYYFTSRHVLPTQRICVFLHISEQAPIIWLHRFNLFVFITETECLLRGTNWVFKYNWS
jgi:hypothetical protein